jgi:hypothetical protein
MHDCDDERPAELREYEELRREARRLSRKRIAELRAEWLELERELANRKDQMGGLFELGASGNALAEDWVVAAVARGERPDAPLPPNLDPDAQEVLILAALDGKVHAVVEAVGVNFRGVVGGSPPGTLLQHAAWIGNPKLVEALLRLGESGRR